MGFPRDGGSWRRWTAAHAVAGVAVFGGTGLLSLLVGPEAFVESREPIPVFVSLFVAGTVIAGPSLAVVEWRLLRERLPRLGALRWLVATVAGTQVAWIVGSLPTMLLALGSEGPARLLQPDVWVIYLLAAALGGVLGVLVALPQWAVLRPLALRAEIWIPATSAAWAVALFLLVVGLGVLSPDASGLGDLIVLFFVSAVTGAGLGAVQGAIALPGLVASEADEPG